MDKFFVHESSYVDEDVAFAPILASAFTNVFLYPADPFGYLLLGVKSLVKTQDGPRG